MLKRLPIGTDDFKEIITDNYYYVDKTKLIKYLIDDGAKVSLFTRPRRFGKSLNISMLENFFDIGTDKNLFSGLYIESQTEYFEKFCGRYPVISLSLKDVIGRSFTEAREELYNRVQDIVLKHCYSINHTELNDLELAYYRRLTQFRMEDLTSGLSLLMRLLHLYYDEKVIVLIDEYDVPLSYAYDNHYYDEMINLIRLFLSKALKGNEDLQFAVLTGCLRISKESVFTGLNNIKVNDITNVAYQDAFGFTEDDVIAMLEYYDLVCNHEIIKEWYDGYRFGDVDIYCPWDVLNYCSSLLSKPNAKPQKYWMNSSGNSIVNHFIDSVIAADDSGVKEDFIRLVQGQPVEKTISTNIVYRDLYSSIDNMWSTLFMTGYLTCKNGYDDNTYNLSVPNLEIRSVIQEIFIDRFKNANTIYTNSVLDFYNALQEGDVACVKEFFCEYLKNYVSIRNANARAGKKEKFYQGLFLGMLILKGNWKAKAEIEYGDGYVDLAMLTDKPDVGIIIEFKYADSESSLDKYCIKALQQIEDKHYADGFFRDHESVNTIYKYGISCYLSYCDVVMVQEDRHDSQNVSTIHDTRNNFDNKEMSSFTNLDTILRK